MMEETRLQIQEHEAVIKMATALVEIRTKRIEILKNETVSQVLTNKTIPEKKAKLSKPLETAAADPRNDPDHVPAKQPKQQELPADKPAKDEVKMEMIVESAKQIVAEKDAKILFTICKEFDIPKLTACSKEQMSSVYVRLQGVLNE